MRKWIAVVGLAVVPACGDSTGPTPDFVGNYTFVVEASSICSLPVSRFDWDLVATSGGGASSSSPGGPFLLTLPGGDPTLNLRLTYSAGGRGNKSSSSNTLNVSIGARAVPFGNQFTVTIAGQAQGTASVAPDGRGQIVDGTVNGKITVAEPRPSPQPSPPTKPSPPPAPVDCTAADHRFTLTPR